MRNVELSKNKYESQGEYALLKILRRKLLTLKEAGLLDANVDLRYENRHNVLEIADRLVKDDEFWEAAPAMI